MNEIKKWETLSSEYIYRSKWATLRKDVCEMSDGRIVEDYYVLEYPDFTNALAITEDNKVLMVQQYRQAAGIVSLEVPGGVVDAGEDPLDAIKRELLEENNPELLDAYCELHKLAVGADTVTDGGNGCEA